MKKIKRLSLLLVTFLILTSAFSKNAFAEEKEAFIVDTRTVYAEIPADFDFLPFSESFYFSDTEGDCIQILQAENFNLENGVKRLTKERAFDIYKYYFDIDTAFYDYRISEGKTEKINGISSYVISGEILTEYTECDSYDDESGNIVPGDYCSQYFIVYIFATKEDTIIISYESGGEKTKENIQEAQEIIKTVLINGTHFDNEKLSVSHNFTNSPKFEDAIQTAIENHNPFDEMDVEVFGPLIAICFVIFVGPVIAIILIAVINIFKYSKNKKILKRYELTYGSISQYNAYPQNYGSYGYNQPVNQLYQPPVNPVYQQNPVNQNVPQTPSYVTNAVNNLEEAQQPQQPVQTPETQVVENNESVGE